MAGPVDRYNASSTSPTKFPQSLDGHFFAGELGRGWIKPIHAGPDGATARNVSWVYAEPKAGHELIRGRYGFYVGNRGATQQGEE